MRQFYSILLLLFIFQLSAHAQQCGFDEHHKQLLQNNPAYKAAIEKNNEDWAKYQELKKMSRLLISGGDTVYEIPVVFHIVHTGGAIGTQYNPTDATLISLIDYVNQSYQAMWSGYVDTNNGGVRVPFKFVIAKRDPNCQPTTGILRVDGSVLPNYVTNGVGTGGAPDLDVKTLSRWPNTAYYNIWLVNHIDGPTGSTAGYAYFPGAGPTIDGTIILANYAVSGAVALVHELGHAMNLYHTFEGDNGGGTCPTNVDCTTDGDLVCDTEPHDRNIACSATINPCTNTSINNTQLNFMSYTGSCVDRFTKGQKERMLVAIKTLRSQLIHSLGAVAPPTPAITATCTPTILNATSTLNAGITEVHFKNINITSGGFTTDGNQVYIDNYCAGNTEIYLDSTYNIIVKSGAQVENVKVYLDLNNDGSFADPGELIFSHNGTMANEVHAGTVTISSLSGATLCQSLRMRVMSDVAAASSYSACSQLSDGQAEDYIVTIKPSTGATLTNAFSAGGNPDCKDSLIEFTATATGLAATATTVWEVNGGPVATGSSYGSTGFVSGDVIRSYAIVNNPTCNTPDTISSTFTTIHIQTGPPAPMISFISSNLQANASPVQWYGPNGLIPGATSSIYHPLTPGYYYAVVISDSCPSVPSNKLNISLLDVKQQYIEATNIYPNPSNTTFTIEWTKPLNATVTLYNMLGQLLHNEQVMNKTKHTVTTTPLPPGIYQLQLRYADGTTDVTKVQVIH